MVKGRGRRKPSPPPLPQEGDTGPDTEAQRVDAVYSVGINEFGRRYQRRYRLHALEIMFERNAITKAECDAGLRFHELHCKTELSPESAFARVYVDTSPKPDSRSLALAQHVAAFESIAHQIPTPCRAPVWHVCILSKLLRNGYSRDGHQAERDTALLRAGLRVLTRVCPIS